MDFSTWRVTWKYQDLDFWLLGYRSRIGSCSPKELSPMSSSLWSRISPQEKIHTDSQIIFTQNLLCILYICVYIYIIYIYIICICILLYMIPSGHQSPQWVGSPRDTPHYLMPQQKLSICYLIVLSIFYLCTSYIQSIFYGPPLLLWRPLYIYIHTHSIYIYIPCIYSMYTLYIYIYPIYVCIYTLYRYSEYTPFTGILTPTHPQGGGRGSSLVLWSHIPI